MPAPSSASRASVFIDGQNLYFAAREAFGYKVPNYDPVALASAVCALKGWKLGSIHFYTGIPSERDDPHWHLFWKRRLSVMGGRGVMTCSRPLQYQTHEILLPDGGRRLVRVGREKGIDVRLALDVVRLARSGELDVAVVFSQDQDLVEVAVEIRAIAAAQQRWIKIVSAFPVGPGSRTLRGIGRTDWIPIPRSVYDGCLDPRDYGSHP